MRALGWLTLLVFLAAPARADEDSVKARAYFDKGMANFQLEEYDAAIAKWQEGFRIKPVPEFLYNIAQAYRLSRRSEKALAFYRKYLRLSPEAQNRVEVQRHIASLEKAIEQQQRASTAPPVQPIPNSIAAEGSETPRETPPPSTPAAVVVKAPEPEKKKIRPWVWGVVGAGAAVVVAAVVVGVVLGTQTSESGPKMLPGVTF